LSRSTPSTATENDGISWITALESASTGALTEQLPLGLFDERNLLEIESPEYLGERLLACRNPQLATLRTHKRVELLAATKKALQELQQRVATGKGKRKVVGADAIGLAVGKVINKYKVAKHFERHIDEASFRFERKLAAIEAEAALDGVYIIRTSVDTGLCARCCCSSSRS
jgi:hypothetical protein